ncbi:MAG: hypothetical protein RRC07_07695 [Anaerolineae bacterium]|nr:hypothetical protein [Anaerolineae bacterium]
MPASTPTPPATATATRSAPASSTSSPTPTITSGPAPTTTPSATPTPQPPATPTATPAPPPATPAPTATDSPYSEIAALPGDPQPYLSRYRLVAYYGSPPSAALGVLGAAPREVILARLREVAATYQALAAPGIHVLPTFHIITTVADRWPGPEGRYSHQMDALYLEEWLAAAREAGVAVIIDIQPGHADLLAEVARVLPYLYDPHVHLAVDSEFTMAAGEIPGYTIGQLNAAQINAVQALLEPVALETGTNKVLVIHQFDTSMVLDKEGIVDYPHVELVIDADGFGSPPAKVSDYDQYAAEPGFEYGAFKLFYDWDWPLMSPPEVMELQPPPAVIIYQ